MKYFILFLLPLSAYCAGDEVMIKTCPPAEVAVIAPRKVESPAVRVEPKPSRKIGVNVFVKFTVWRF